MQTMAVRIIALMMMVLAPRVAKSEGDEVQAGVLSEQTEGKQQQNEDVDIAKFYANDEVIIILGSTKSDDPCMVDVVTNTNNTGTSFTRHYNFKQNSRSKQISLYGKFKEVALRDVKPNAMDVTVDQLGATTRRSYSLQFRGNNLPWDRVEAIAYESRDGQCAIFSIKPLHTSSRPSETVADTYDFRWRKSIRDLKKAQECFQTLKSQAQREVEIPETLFTSCWKACQTGNTCTRVSSGPPPEPHNVQA
uniref:Lipocalin n=1 Tax=Rhipicephalus appendiculatus TaxID=34631 RepID=A0A131YSE2_RHIAP